MFSSRLVRIVLMLSVTSVSVLPVRAADENAFSDPVVGKLNDKIMRFLQSVAQGDEDDAFNEVLAGSQLNEQAGAIKGLVDKSKEIVDRYGAHRENEAISAKRIGKDVVLLKYLFKCEKFPVVWHVTYYRDSPRSTTSSDDHWVVIALRFDTQLESLAN